MLRIHIGMQETDGHRFNAFSADLLNNRLEVLAVQPLLNRTIPAYSLTHRMNITRRDQWLRLTVLQGIQLLAITSCDSVDIVKASSSHQQYTRPAPFQKCVQPDGSAMDQERNLAEVADQICQTGYDTACRVVWCAQDLAGEGIFLLLVIDHKIGERSANVN